MKPLVLASTSPFRATLLTKLGIPFISARPDCDETPAAHETHSKLVKRLALGKALSLAETYPDHWIIGSDQVAKLNNQILGKPGSHIAATKQLQNASGQRVVFHTGLCLLDTSTGKSQVDEALYRVQFRTLDADQIERYLLAEEPYQCAGSFKSEGMGITLFEKLEGDDPNALIGLPLILLCRMLDNLGLKLP